MPQLLPKNRDHGWAPYVWLVFLAFFFFQPIFDHADAREWIITGTASAAFMVLYFAIFWVRPPITYLTLVAMAAMGLGLAKYNPNSSVFIIFCSSFIPWVFQTARRALLALAMLIAAVAIHAVIFHDSIGFWAVSIVVALGVAGSNIHFAEKNRADTKLRMAHEEIEQLAKVAERERIARDLHDVLGHTLTLISVKATLTGKLLDKYSGNPDSVSKARGQIADIEKVSREAMAEIRATLRGYNTYNLSEEFTRAKSALSSAGVAVGFVAAEVDLSPAQESVVALIMREAVTNVVRHAHARNCRVSLVTNNGDCVFEIEDDGCGGTLTEGNGLRGMRERVEALGGTLVRETNSGTKLRFEFPLAASGNGNH